MIGRGLWESDIMKIIRSDDEFVATYSEFIYKEVSNCYSILQEAVQFLTKMKSYNSTIYMPYVTVHLNSFPDASLFLGFSMFAIYVELDEKITFTLIREGEDVARLDIDGFSCWNEEDEEKMYEIRKKYEEEHGGPDLLYP
jgi:hypothetical protein